MSADAGDLRVAGRAAAGAVLALIRAWAGPSIGFGRCSLPADRLTRLLVVEDALRAALGAAAQRPEA